MIAAGLVLVAASNLWLAQLDTSSTYVARLLGPMVLTGVGVGLGFMPLTVAALSDVEPEHAGTASGLLQMAQQIGGSLGLAVLVTVYASHTEPGRVVAGMSASFHTAAAFVLLALVLAGILLGRPRPAKDEPAAAEFDLAA